jgi:endonuclease-8
MPEGDTIHRAAATLQTALAGRIITGFQTGLAHLARVNDEAPLTGRTVQRVYAAGKNLVIEFSGDLHLRTHMRMNGSWHIYRPGETWRKSRSNMRLLLETAEWVAVAFNVPVAEFHDSSSIARQRDLRLIGPDLLGETFDLDEAVRRIRARPDEEMADVLLNQRVVAGIGNEYKSELLFITRINPFTPVSKVTDEQLVALLERSRKVMQANVTSRVHQRQTTGSMNRDEPLFVYGRGGQPCRRCGTPIKYRKQGRDVRGTYWCAGCQGEAEGEA